MKKLFVRPRDRSRPGVRCGVGEAVETGVSAACWTDHTVGPMYSEKDAASLLQNAYRNTLQLARNHGIEYIAFPAISCGIFGYPVDEAAEIALKTIGENAEGFKEIHFVLFETSAHHAWFKAAKKAHLEPVPLPH